MEHECHADEGPPLQQCHDCAAAGVMISGHLEQGRRL